MRIHPNIIEIIKVSVVDSFIGSLLELYQDDPQKVALALWYVLRENPVDAPRNLSLAGQHMRNLYQLFDGRASFATTFGPANPGLDVLRLVIYRSAIAAVRASYSALHLKNHPEVNWFDDLAGQERIAALQRQQADKREWVDRTQLRPEAEQNRVLQQKLLIVGLERDALDLEILLEPRVRADADFPVREAGHFQPRLFAVPPIMNELRGLRGYFARHNVYQALWCGFLTLCWLAAAAGPVTFIIGKGQHQILSQLSLSETDVSALPVQICGFFCWVAALCMTLSNMWNLFAEAWTRLAEIAAHERFGSVRALAHSISGFFYVPDLVMLVHVVRSSVAQLYQVLEAMIGPQRVAEVQPRQQRNALLNWNPALPEARNDHEQAPAQ